MSFEKKTLNHNTKPDEAQKELSRMSNQEMLALADLISLVDPKLGGKDVFKKYEKLTWASAWGRIKDDVSGFAGVFSTLPDLVLEKLARMIEPSDLGRAAGEIYEVLAKNSLHKPNPVAVVMKDMARDEWNKSATGKNHLARALRGNKEKITGLLLGKKQERIEEAPEYIEEVTDSIIFETLNKNSVQEGSQNIISEHISNVISTKIAGCTAGLKFHDKKSGKTIELDKMLPARVYFVPGINYKKDDEITDEIEEDEANFKEYYRLNKYHGTQDNADTFVCTKDRVVYGDLTAPGGMLSLLHEITHSWQQEYHQVGSRSIFDDRMMSALGMLGAIENMSVETGQDFAEMMEQYGRTSAGDKIMLDVNQSLAEDEFRVSQSVFSGYTSDKEKAIVKSEDLAEKLNTYIHEEREAWAHAIRVLRYLRKKGVDLEPQLKMGDDINKYTHKCLETYQKSLESMVEGKGLKYDFLRPETDKN